MPYRLVFISGPQKGKRLTVQQGAVVIGRDPDCAIAIADDEVSRRHAVIEERPQGVYVRDLGSMNGVVVNGTALREARLKHGDTLELGHTKIQFQDARHAEVPPHRRRGRVQGLTLAAVALIIGFELIFLLGLSLWHKDVLETPAPAPAARAANREAERPEQAPAAAEPEADVFAQAEARLQELQAAAPEASAAPEDAAAVTEELETLREDVRSIREEVQDLGPAAEEPDAAVEAAPAEPAPPPPAATPADALVARAEEMMKEAADAIERQDLAQADTQLERIQILAPDFLPAYIERARLFERRGLFGKAGEQWNAVVSRSVGTPLYEQAAAERIRLARAEMVRETVAGPSREAGPARRLPRRLRLLSVDYERLQDSEQYEEIRLVRATIKSKPGDRDIDSTEVQVMVTFFDEDVATKELALTRAIVPQEPLRVEGEWKEREPEVVTATYLVKRGFRNEELAQFGQKRKYYGYVVQVYYREELQDETARPKSLLKTFAEIEPPWHQAQPAVPAPEPAPTPSEATGDQ